MIVTLRDGTRVLIRHIRPEDKAAFAEAFLRLSDETRRLRFLVPKPRLTSTELRYFTEVDRSSHVALVAVLAEEPGAIIAVGRFVRLVEDPMTAEFAIVVGDAYQSRGLGTELAQRLSAEARLRGVRRFTATILSENVAVRRLLEHISAGLGGAAHRGGVQELVAELAA
jgi:RimJ/RimL family protein N-acetyltransferase